MSHFSGKCDLYDHVFGGAFDWDDYFNAFDAFKKKTGGKLYQERKVIVSKDNQDAVCRMNHELSYSNTAVMKTDKKGNTKEVIETRYMYWGTIYPNLRELNKHGVYIKVEIPFSTVMDLIPYYPYVVAARYWSNDKEMCIIAQQSQPDREIRDALESGWLSEGRIDFQMRYKRELQKHYIEVCDVLCDGVAGRTRVDWLAGNLCDQTEYPEYPNGYVAFLTHEPDINHELEFVWTDGKTHSHWTSPKILDSEKFAANLHPILIDKKDVEQYLKDDLANGAVGIRYVARRQSYEKSDD